MTMTTTPATGTGRGDPAALRMTPARWVTLAIGLPLVLAVIGWSAFSIVGAIGRSSFPVNVPLHVKDGKLAVSVAGGDITMRPGQGAHLSGTIQYSLIRPSIIESPGGNAITIRCSLLVGNCGLDATLEAPAATNVTLSTGGGDLTADDLAGILSFDTGGGNVNGSTLTSQNAHVRSGGGDVRLTFTKPPKDLDIHSSGGNITVVLPPDSPAYAVGVTNDGGNVTDSLSTDAASPDTITVNSAGGDISLTEAH